MIDWPAKAPAEVADYAFDWTESLDDGESIATRTVSAEGVTVNSSAIVGGLVRVWLSGGTEGTVATVTATITTNGGRTFSEIAVLPIGTGPISLAEAKAYLRVTSDEEDSVIASQLAAAVQMVEDMTSKALTTRVVAQVARGFPGIGPIRLFTGPVQQVLDVAYDDSDGIEQSLAEFELKASLSAASLYPATGESFPVTSGLAGSVRVTMVAGYEPGQLPAALKSAVLMIVAWLYSDRGDGGSDMPSAVRAMVSPYRPMAL